MIVIEIRSAFPCSELQHAVNKTVSFLLSAKHCVENFYDKSCYAHICSIKVCGSGNIWDCLRVPN